MTIPRKMLKRIFSIVTFPEVRLDKPAMIFSLTIVGRILVLK